MGRKNSGRGGAHLRRIVGAGHALLLPLRAVDAESGIPERGGFHRGQNAQVPGAWRPANLRRARQILVRRAGRRLPHHSKPRPTWPAPRRDDAMPPTLRRRGPAASAVIPLLPPTPIFLLFLALRSDEGEGQAPGKGIRREKASKVKTSGASSFDPWRGPPQTPWGRTYRTTGYLYRGSSCLPKTSTCRLASASGSTPWSPCQTNHSGWAFSTSASILRRTSSTVPMYAKSARSMRAMVASSIGSNFLPYLASSSGSRQASKKPK